MGRKVLSLSASSGCQQGSEDEVMMPTRPWEQKGTVQKDYEDSS